MAKIAELKAIVTAGRDDTDPLADYLIQELVGRVEHAEGLAQIRGQHIETWR
jgi:hypothetical protein